MENERRWTVRPIEAKDNQAVEAVIRQCLLEYAMDKPGTAWCDPYLGRFYDFYREIPAGQYWVAEVDGRVVGGVGVGPLEGAPGVCELQKMYCLPEARGTGIAHDLLERALAFAAEHYGTCYLETAKPMIPAQRFYAKHGFEHLDAPLGATGHYGCDVPMARKLG